MIAARLLWLLPWVIAPVMAQTTADIDDAAVRMQFAFYTADARALRQVIRELQTVELPPDLQSFGDYYQAYGYWKLVELANDNGERARAVRECATHASAAAARLPTEARILSAACMTLPDAADFPSSANKLLQKTLAANPKNPRVLLLDALWDQAAHSRTRGTPSCAKFTKAVAAFESAPPSTPGQPDWGYAEALAQFGKCALNNGDRIAARNLIEKALVIAPDYRWAQQLLQDAAQASQ